MYSTSIGTNHLLKSDPTLHLTLDGTGIEQVTEVKLHFLSDAKYNFSVHAVYQVLELSLKDHCQ